ncbi:MAG: glycosyltransferase family 4 protein [Clostridia bacterium]|nr:glycosyltransferase family 4 protein [Clostridia bacterium]
MKILITTDLFATATNGVVTSVRNLSDELTRKGHDVRILTLSDSLTSRRDGAVYYIRSMPIGIYPNVRMPLSYHHRLIKELIAWKTDVIHSQCEFFSLQFARYIAKKTKAPIIHTYHTLYEQYVTYVIPSKRLGKLVVRAVSRNRLRSVHTVIVPTRKVEDALLEYGLRKPIRVVPSGISLTQHKRRMSPKERAEKRKALGIAEKQSVLLNLGRLGTEKNLDELLHFFASALAYREDMIFLIVGDGPARAQLQKLAEELGISEHVMFTGMVDPSEVQDYYQLGDVFVSASTSETQGLTYIEAAANGLPLLCRRDPCLQDVIAQGENGYAYTTEAEFLDGIHALFEHPEQRIAAGKRSEEIAAAFDKETFGAAVEAIYASVL